MDAKVRTSLGALGIPHAQAAPYLLHLLSVQAIRDQQPRGPYLLRGWSMGGPIALEVAQQLQAGGEEIGLLALLDPPSLDAADAPEVDDAGQVLRFFKYLASTSDKDLELDESALESLTLDEKVVYLFEREASQGADR